MKMKQRDCRTEAGLHYIFSCPLANDADTQAVCVTSEAEPGNRYAFIGLFISILLLPEKRIRLRV